MEFQLALKYLVILSCFLGFLHLFVRNAHRFGLSDKPNFRSSHDYPVVRGGGFVFGLGWLIVSAIEGSFFNAFNLGLLLLMIIGLWDDINGLSSFIRLFIQFVSVFLMAYFFDLFNIYGIAWACILILMITYLINVFNFMDGINGILGLNALTVFYLFFKSGLIEFNTVSAYFVLFLSLISFLFFNFRIKAKVFSGDVGSLSVSFLLIGGLLHLYTTFNPVMNGFMFSAYLLIPVSIFMIDSLTTILHRLMHRENIFQSHRFHLYQIITPTYTNHHLLVSLIYAFFQLAFTYFISVLTDIRYVILSFLFLFFLFFLLRIVLLRRSSQLTGR